MLNPFDKLKKSLARTKENIFGRLSSILRLRKIDDDLLDEMEEILIEADVGVKATMRLIDYIKTTALERKLTEGEEIVGILKEEVSSILSGQSRPDNGPTLPPPAVWLIVGVNGVGKTTTIGKLATVLSTQGKKVMIAACDTFRAAAIDQIAIWAERSRVPIVRAQEGADPASVAFDAAQAAKARGVDILLIDTAGRLHTKSHLMEELSKVRRVIAKALPQSAILTKLVLDGTTGQNALSQVQVFTDAVGCDGVIVTKLDGTAKGGIIIAIAAELGVPVEYIGLGEGIDDLQRFDPSQFAESLFT